MAKKKPSFQSYLQQNNKTKASFKAYVDFKPSSNEEQVQSHAASWLELGNRGNAATVSQGVESMLHPGELVICETRDVIRFTPFRDNTQGVMGSLFCTNYRLIYISVDKYQGMQAASHRNLLLRDEDITLGCISTLYQVTKRKKSKLNPGSNVSSHVKVLEIHCKDFRMFTYSFKHSNKSYKTESKKMVNAILHHAFPTRAELLFAYDYQGLTAPDVTQSMPLLYNLSDHWAAELHRVGVTEWDVKPANPGYRLCASLPEFWVMPRRLTVADVGSAAPFYGGNRPPLWSYTYSNGADLVRMSELIPDAIETRGHEKILDAIKSCNKNNGELYIIDLQTTCPTVKDIQNSYEKLKDLCMPITVKEVQDKDSSWYSGLESTGWLHQVSACLTAANNAVSTMVGRCQTVVLSEPEGCDLVCVVSCLAQIMLDPHYRTLHGFQSLIQREWVALGHRFLDRCGHIRNSKDEECPVFLLFLDCVWQLSQQYPGSLQFSETYLICLWDSVFNPIFETFIFNSDRERSIASRHSHVYSTSVTGFVKMMSVWNWCRQFAEEDQALFYNPMYLARMELDLESVEVPPNYSYSHSSDNNFPATNFYEESTLTDSFADTISLRSFIGARSSSTFLRKQKEVVEYNPPLPAGVLRATTKRPSLKLWSQCYLRWLTPLQIIAGGAPALYLQQCHLVDEIRSLQEEVNQLDAAVKKPANMSYVNKNLLFSQSAYGSDSEKWRRTLTSSFPFLVPGNVTGLSGTQSLDIYLSGAGERPMSGLRYSTDDSMEDLTENSTSTPATEHETKRFI